MILLALFLIARPIFSAELILNSTGYEFAKGDTFDVEVHLNTTGDSINAIEGEILIPDILEVAELKIGNSLINFWVEKPYLANGAVSFSGVTSGGLSGSGRYIFTMVLRGKEEGVGSIKVNRFRALLNDGVGTETSVKLSETSIAISENILPIVEEKEPNDIYLPEDFKPLVGSDSSIFEGKNFLVFITQDKHSGINHYEVREGRWGSFKTAESPYLLINQDLDKKVYVKAVDNFGNERVAVYRPDKLSWKYNLMTLLAIIFMLVVAYFLLRKPKNV
ncbi:MAG: hypothetical protein AAB840_02230 [Patescibacteria group bacterium]